MPTYLTDILGGGHNVDMTMTRISADTLRQAPYALDELMPDSHVIHVHADGVVTDAVNAPYAPEVHWSDGAVHVPSHPAFDVTWVPFSIHHSGAADGGRDGVMHPSEYIGGALARDILAEPGFYVGVVVEDHDAPEGDDEPVGWMVLRCDALEHVDYPHEPGRLYDCAACEGGPCMCEGDETVTPCLSTHCTRSSEAE